jgi:hypothetical protein
MYELLACSSACYTHGSLPRVGVWDLKCYQHRRFVDQTVSEADNFPPLGTNPFQRGSKVSEISEDMFNMDLGPFQQVTMLPNSMASSRLILIFPFSRRGSG